MPLTSVECLNGGSTFTTLNGKQWRRAPSVNETRYNFGCVTLHDRYLYAIGNGSNSLFEN